MAPTLTLIQGEQEREFVPSARLELHKRAAAALSDLAEAMYEDDPLLEAASTFARALERRFGYRCRWTQDDERQMTAPQPEEPRAAGNGRAEVIGRWRRTPFDQKRDIVLDAVSAGPCTMRELSGRTREAHGIYQCHIEPVVKEMLRLGYLERIPTGGRGSQPRWLYQAAGAVA